MRKPWFRKKDGWWCVKVDLDNGRRGNKRLSQDKEQAMLLWHAIQAASAVPIAAGGNAFIADAVKSYLREIEAGLRQRRLSPDDRLTMRTALEELCMSCGNLPPREFGPLKLLGMQRRLRERNLPAAKVNRSVWEIRRFFRWSVARELISFTQYFALLCVETLPPDDDDATG